MEQLTIFSDGGETLKKENSEKKYNSNDFVRSHFKKRDDILMKQVKDEQDVVQSKLKDIEDYNKEVSQYNSKLKADNLIYKGSEIDNQTDSLVNSEMFFDNENVGGFFICIDYLKDNNKDEYDKVDISDVKHFNDKRYIPVNKYSELAYGGSVNQDKVAKVMHEFKKGKLYSSSGSLVTNRKQAIAIALSEARRIDKKEVGGYTYLPYEKKTYKDGGDVKQETKVKTPTNKEFVIYDFNLNHFYKFVEPEFRHFFKKTLGADLKSDGTFRLNNELYYIRPMLKKTSDGKILLDAIFSINNRGREVAEITFDPKLKDEKFNANSEVFGWNNYEFKAGGVAYTIPFDYKILGIYQVVGKNLNAKIEIVGFEKENDTSYAFYQPLYGGKNKEIGSLIVPFTKIRNISNGKTVFVETSKGDKVKITRLGSVNDGILFEFYE
jgi:hypothetical protein